MFDTKIYHQFGCACLGCHPSYCTCDYHIGRTGVEREMETARGTVLMRNAYWRGFMDGRKESDEPIRFRTPEETERFAKKLRDAMVPLASLGGPPALPGRLEEFDSSGNVQCTPCREPPKHHDREYPWTTTTT
jgi:hypothetical protein